MVFAAAVSGFGLLLITGALVEAFIERALGVSDIEVSVRRARRAGQ